MIYFRVGSDGHVKRSVKLRVKAGVRSTTIKDTRSFQSFREPPDCVVEGVLVVGSRSMRTRLEQGIMKDEAYNLGMLGGVGVPYVRPSKA